MIRPPFRPKTPIKCVGPYVGAGDPKVKAEQWDEIGKDLYDAGYNQLSVFLTLDTPLDFYPWPKVDNVYDFGTIRPDWEEHIYTMMERLAFWRISPKVKFVDSYHGKNDPFDQGLKPFDDEELYSSWANDRYNWIMWDELVPRHYTNFRPVNAFGRGMINYIHAVVRCAKRVKDLKNPAGKPLYPDFRIVIAWANETHAIFEGNATHPSKTLGDRDEILFWIQGLFHEAGFENNKNMLVEVDYLAFRPNVRSVDYNIMAKVRHDLAKKGQRLEIHGILSIADIKKYTNITLNIGGVPVKFDPKTCLFSTDGDLGMNGKYVELGHSPHHVDLKLDCTIGQPFFPANFMQFWRTYFPKYRTYVK